MTAIGQTLPIKYGASQFVPRGTDCNGYPIHQNTPIYGAAAVAAVVFERRALLFSTLFHCSQAYFVGFATMVYCVCRPVNDRVGNAKYTRRTACTTRATNPTAPCWCPRLNFLYTARRPRRVSPKKQETSRTCTAR